MIADAPLVRCDGAARTFGSGPAATVALQADGLRGRAPATASRSSGPSGSGKSTLLHLMAGPRRADGRDGHLAGTRRPADLRPGPVAVVFQGPSLLPPLTVVENVALPLLLGGAQTPRRAERSRAALERLGLRELARQAARGDLRRPGAARRRRARARGVTRG